MAGLGETVVVRDVATMPGPQTPLQLLRWSAVLLVATVWLSAGLFGLYILAFYAGAFADGSLQEWNRGLRGLYEPDATLATLGIGLHFAAGGVLLALGPIQLVTTLRQRLPRLHRWIGRVYVFSALAAGLGGLAFIALRGTIGGAPMSIGFALYGVLMVTAAVQVFRYARHRRVALHRGWAIRLFALAIGSWLYRMYYGFWMLLAGGLGHTRDFDGWFDVLMAYFFFVPNLLVAEIFIRARGVSASAALQSGAAAALAFATALVALGTYYFVNFSWGPAILARLT